MRNSEDGAVRMLTEVYADLMGRAPDAPPLEEILGRVAAPHPSPHRQGRYRWLSVAAALIALMGVGAIALVRSSGTSTDGAVTPQADSTPHVPITSPWPPPGVNEHTADYVIGRHSITVEGVPFSFTIPAAGWEPDGSLLVSKSTHGPQGAEAIIFWAGFPDGTHADPCARVPLWPEPPSVADLAAAVAAVPGTELVSGPSDVTVGGYAAQHVVLIVREDVGCDPGFFYNWKAKNGGAMWEATELGDTINVWIVDVDGTRLFIAGETHLGAGSTVEQEIQEIVASIRFD